WDAFLTFAAVRRPTLIEHLSKCAVRGLDADAVALTAPRGFRFDYLSRKDHLHEIDALAAEFFGRPVRLQITAGDPAAAVGNVEAPRPSTADLTSVAMENPAVQAAVSILGGEVAEVRERRPRRREAE
ncbi:MAG: hypothetical protein ABI629_23615, partial [bacterium]